MSTDIRDYIKNIDTLEWKALQEEGIDTAGILVKVLRYDEAQKSKNHKSIYI